MGKDFTGAKGLGNNLKKDPTTIRVEKSTAAAEPASKKRPGRPKTKTENTKTINIAVPVSVLEKIEIAKCKYNNNMTEYINAIIRTDLEANMEKYETLYKLLND